MKFFASLFLLLSASFVLAENPIPSSSPSPKSGASASPSPKPSKADKQKKKDKKDKSPEANATASPGDASKKDATDDIDIPVPIGDPVKGIRIPHYDEKGKLVMVFNADEARKTDSQHLSMQNLKIDANGDDGKKFYVEMPQAIFDMETRILSGDQRVSIRRDDFTITGQKGEFYIKTRFAKITGDVKMVILNTENLTN